MHPSLMSAADSASAETQGKLERYAGVLSISLEESGEKQAAKARKGVIGECVQEAARRSSSILKLPPPTLPLGYKFAGRLSDPLERNEPLLIFWAAKEEPPVSPDLRGGAWWLARVEQVGGGEGNSTDHPCVLAFASGGPHCASYPCTRKYNACNATEWSWYRLTAELPVSFLMGIATDYERVSRHPLVDHGREILSITLPLAPPGFEVCKSKKGGPLKGCCPGEWSAEETVSSGEGDSIMILVPSTNRQSRTAYWKMARVVETTKSAREDEFVALLWLVGEQHLEPKKVTLHESAENQLFGSPGKLWAWYRITRKG